MKGDTKKNSAESFNEFTIPIVYNLLYYSGFEKIFCKAIDGAEEKCINAVVVGMGKLGTEMSRALSWFCQMDGYRFGLDCFDIDDKAEEKFIALCPELMDEHLNGRYDIDGEARYKITVHSGVNAESDGFLNTVLSCGVPTYIFVALGCDRKNTDVALDIGCRLQEKGVNATVQTFLYDSSAPKNANNVEFLSVNQYSTKNCDVSKVLVEKAFRRHLKNGTRQQFFESDFHFRSTIASVIHREMKIKCKIAGSEKENPEDRTDEELWTVRILEHRRWNAFMRAEGYRFAGTTEKSAKSHAKKLHNCLVPFDELPYEEQIKDDF